MEATTYQEVQGLSRMTVGELRGKYLEVFGEETRLPAIDRLEGFHPGSPCLYRRVLVPVQVNGTDLPAWLYVGENPIPGRLKPLGMSIWSRQL